MRIPQQSISHNCRSTFHRRCMGLQTPVYVKPFIVLDRIQNGQNQGHNYNLFDSTVYRVNIKLLDNQEDVIKICTKSITPRLDPVHVISSHQEQTSDNLFSGAPFPPSGPILVVWATFGYSYTFGQDIFISPISVISFCFLLQRHIRK